MGCREVREYLPAYVELSGGPRSELVDHHLRTCASCRAELEQFRELSSDLSGLADHVVEPPSWLLGTLTETVAEKASKVAAFRAKTEKVTDPKVIAGGAILVAGVAGALMVRGRRRRRRGLRELLAEA